MIRLSGILIGSMLAVAILILLIGVPRFPGKEIATTTLPPMTAGVAPETQFKPAAQSTSAVKSTLAPEPSMELEPGSESKSESESESESELESELESGQASRSASQSEPQGEPQTNAQSEQRSAAAAATPPDPQPAAAETGQVNPETLFMQPDQHWYAFWSPFRSEIAANGFVAQLQRVTGFDYRVVKQKPGVYEVALAYSNDAEIPQMLEQISAATGLDIPES